MNLLDLMKHDLTGRLKLSVVDAATNIVLDEWEDNNVVVTDSKKSLIKAISSTSTNYTINNVKIGYDTGEFSTPTISFADTNPDTIVRTTGSWITDGFLGGDLINVTGSTFNNNNYTLTGVTATTLTLSVGDTLIVEGPISSARIMRGTTDAPVSPTAAYTPANMLLLFASPSVLGVSYPDLYSVTFNTTIIGADVLALYPGFTSKIFTSAGLFTGDGSLFAYRRFPKKSISALVNINISWTISY